MLKSFWKYALLLFVLGSAGAQEASFRWRLYYADPGDFVITSSSGRQENYSAAGLPPAGIILSAGEMIHTGRARAEFQLEPAAGPSGRADYTILKIGENTSLVFSGEKDGKTTLQLLYGRIRLISGSGNSRPLSVSFRNTAAEFREGDLGIDYLIQNENSQSTQPVLMVHGFKGGGDIVPLVQEGSSDIVRLPVRQGETVVLEFHTPFSYVERRALAQDVLGYWERYNFAGTASYPMPDLSLPLPPDLAAARPAAAGQMEAAKPAAEPGYTDFEAFRRKQKAGIGIGLVLIGSGAAMQNLGYFDYGFLDESARKGLFMGSYLPMGLGAILLLSAALANP